MYVFYFFVCNMCAHVLGSQKRTLDLLELGLQGVVSNSIWVLGTEFRQAPLTAKPTLQPLNEFFMLIF